MKNRYLDYTLGIFFSLLTVVFITLALTNEQFFTWVFRRHHNQLSWYIRPLFLIPFCFFSYKRSFTGIGATLFGLFTSMFWFPVPENISAKVSEFLAMEMAYLHGSWDITRILFTLTIPVTFFLLSLSLWKRKLKTGLYVVVFMAFIKILWSIMEGGESGTSILVPAFTGLVLCISIISFGFRALEKRKMKHKQEAL